MPLLEDIADYLRGSLDSIADLGVDEKNRLIVLSQHKARSVQRMVSTGSTTLAQALPHIKAQLATEAGESLVRVSAEARLAAIDAMFNTVLALLGNVSA